jgi:hypothetical protein
MKKIVSLGAAMLIILALVSAPAAAEIKVNFGLKGGVSLSNNAWSDDDGSEKMLIRPTFGVFAVINLSPAIAIQPEVNYLTTGEWWYETTDGNEKIVETFNYLHIPVLLKVRLMKEGKIIPAIFAGPAISFLLSMKEAGESFKEFFKSTDFGLDFGLDVEMPTGNMKVILDARYYLGLTNAYSYDPAAFSMKNRAFIITAGLVF